MWTASYKSYISYNLKKINSLAQLGAKLDIGGGFISWAMGVLPEDGKTQNFAEI